MPKGKRKDPGPVPAPDGSRRCPLPAADDEVDYVEKFRALSSALRTSTDHFPPLPKKPVPSVLASSDEESDFSSNMDTTSQAPLQPAINQETSTGTKSLSVRPRPHPALQTKNADQDDFTTFFISATDNSTFKDLNKQTLATALRDLSPDIKTFRFLRAGGLAIDVYKKDSADLLLTVSSFAGKPVTISKPSVKVSSRGTVSGVYDSADQLKALYLFHSPDNPELISVTRLGKSNTYVLDFATPRPDKVTIFYTKHTVSPFYSRPLRCLNCQRFGHYAKDCRSKGRCSLCSSPEHDHKKCTSSEFLCANCGQTHPAISKDCPHRTFHLNVNKQAAFQSISRHQARRELSRSYAEAASRPSSSSYSSPVNPVKPTTFQASQPAEPVIPVSKLPLFITTLLSVLFPERTFDADLLSEKLLEIL